jgi:adenine-specific DNA-methyltransferase
MAKKKSNGDIKTTDYRHTGETRTNIPPAKIAAEGRVPKVPKVQYQYSPHLPPTLQSDPTGKTDRLSDLLVEAGRRPLTTQEQKLMANALRQQQPWLEWSGKREQNQRGFFEVDPVALHIHERVSTQAMMRVLAREDVQRDLFADPQQPYANAVQFYKHNVDWANRIILGDSLQVMTSLARRENLAGSVQMIYLDPPYGIRFASNFQPELGKRDVKDRDQDLTREPEMVRAYRDTWTLGVHSYLSYLRDRLTASKELLNESGSIFVQISDENIHRVRSVLDEVFGPENFIALITFQTSVPLGATFIPGVCSYLLFYAKNRDRLKFRRGFRDKPVGEGGAYTAYQLPNGEIRGMSRDEASGRSQLPEGSKPFFNLSMLSAGTTPSCVFTMEAFGRSFEPGGGRSWKTNPAGFSRIVKAERVIPTESTLRYLLFHSDYSVGELTDLWTDVGSVLDKLYVVQTNTTIVERCLLMTTDPGDLVLDPTCGSGTTAYVAEQWGRRWITCDTSRVSVSLARQRLMTARFPYYELRPIEPADLARNPHGRWLPDPDGQIKGNATFRCKTIPHITLGSIARNTALDPIFAKHEPALAARLNDLNTALGDVTDDIRRKMAAKLTEKQKAGGKRAVTEGDRRRWILPSVGWHEWDVPFDADQEWPQSLRETLAAYRSAWANKMHEVNSCIAANADLEELVDRPEVVSSVVRVSGPFSVEGVRPEELSLSDSGLFDPTPNEFTPNYEHSESVGQNMQSYLSQMVGHLRTDGLTFLGNQHRKLSRLDALFDDASASLIHAEGSWDGAESQGGNTVAISFGPQHGPVTALQVEEAIRAAKQYDDLVLAGFSFDAEAFAVAQEQNHPKLRVHLAHIRPDLNEAMAGLLKDTPNSELFAVFGQPEIDLKETNQGWVCTLKGVDIYNPLDNTVRSSGADKIAAWFLDSDFDGRCFCITQAFFPDQNAWEKLAKALASGAEAEAFEKLKGTTSLPFPKGKFGRVAVKVIDPRGNEVMAIRNLG